jgi:large subunit ribosomal protein L10
MASVGRMVKESSVTEISNRLAERPNFFIAALNRLPAAEADAFRRKLYGSKASLLMVKRRLGLRALDPLKIDGLAKLLEGPIGLVLAEDDPLPVAKLIVEFRKGHEEQVAVRGAFIDGQLLDTPRVEELAKLPAKPVLLATVVGVLEAPMTDVILTVEQLIGDIAFLAEEAAKSKPATEPGTPPQAGSAKQVPGAEGDRPAQPAPEAKKEDAAPAQPAASAGDAPAAPESNAPEAPSGGAPTEPPTQPS